MSEKVLVAYATKMGATAEIAAAIGTELRKAGHDVDVRNVTEVGSIMEYDAVVLGSAIYTRRWRPEAVRFLRRHVGGLRDRQVWLFHSGPVGPDKDQVQSMPPKVARLADKIGATRAATWPPTPATGTRSQHGPAPSAPSSPPMRSPPPTRTMTRPAEVPLRSPLRHDDADQLLRRLWFRSAATAQAASLRISALSRT